MPRDFRPRSASPISRILLIGRHHRSPAYTTRARRGDLLASPGRSADAYGGSIRGEEAPRDARDGRGSVLVLGQVAYPKRPLRVGRREPPLVRFADPVALALFGAWWPGVFGNGFGPFGAYLALRIARRVAPGFQHRPVLLDGGLRRHLQPQRRMAIGTSAGCTTVSIDLVMFGLILGRRRSWVRLRCIASLDT